MSEYFPESKSSGVRLKLSFNYATESYLKMQQVPIDQNVPKTLI